MAEVAGLWALLLIKFGGQGTNTFTALLARENHSTKKFDIENLVYESTNDFVCYVQIASRANCRHWSERGLPEWPAGDWQMWRILGSAVTEFRAGRLARASFRGSLRSLANRIPACGSGRRRSRSRTAWSQIPPRHVFHARSTKIIRMAQMTTFRPWKRSVGEKMRLYM